MKIAVCDDEPGFLHKISQELEQYYKSLDVGILTFQSGSELIEAVREDPFLFMCIFMDVEMPGLSGFQTAVEIQKINRQIPILLLTSHTEYALKGYEIQAFRFLQKPLEREALHRALAAVEAQCIRHQKVVIGQDGRDFYLPVEDILYIKSENVYLSVWIKGSEDYYLVRKKLREQIEELPRKLFFQVHRSYIVNLGHVHSYDGEKILLTDGTKIPVSRRKRALFQEAMSYYLRDLASGG